MLNTSSLHAVNFSTFSQHFLKPLYDSYCFSNLPQTISFLLTGEGQSGLPLDVFGSLAFVTAFPFVKVVGMDLMDKAKLFGTDA